MTSVYPKGVEETPVDPGRPPLMVRKGIEKIKAEVDILTVAQGYGEFKPVGSARWEGRCLAPDHEDKTPSMSVKVDTQRVHCFGCGFDGDVIDLVRLVEGGETWEAMMSLSLRYGVELPQRPEGWFRRKERQRPIRDELDRHRALILRRRLYRIVEPLVLAVEDDALREEVARDLWGSLEPLAERMLDERRKERAS
ncbi:MAG: CHC2 zinc finger domain-containing protein [Actinomycetota bacterium]|nr:CHC2 zinc finger domain-containing protein [Actinomycetota bacterium]